MQSVKINKELNYPLLMEYTNPDYDTFIVLMFKYRIGTVVYTTNPKVHTIGVYLQQWNMNEFKPFTGVLELSNE